MKNIKSVLVTGGTGFFGKNFVNYIVKKYPKLKRLIIFSRDELKQYEMSQIFSQKKYPFIRYFIGDIRDKSRLIRALYGVDIVIHAAALKQVPLAEYNPFEFIKTNIYGAQNLIEACLDTDVKKVIALSTDKASSPINLYGATKLCSDKLFVSANYLAGKKNLSFSIVRYGNVLGSRGSVVPFFIEQQKKGIIPITHKDMTRFSIDVNQAIELVIWSILNCKGGEILIPKIKSYNIMDLAKAIGINCDFKFIGVRPGEKLHEEMISKEESLYAYEFGKNYALISNPNLRNYSKKFKIKKIKNQFTYNSRNNDFLSISEIKKLVFDFKKNSGIK
jgi:UDP-N-acetylglucosamine 4,6-dehydratase/5-epimerase